MRSYSDLEARTIAEAQPLLIMEWEEFSSLAEEPEDALQFIADLEFETKFSMLLRSISLRWPAL